MANERNPKHQRFFADRAESNEGQYGDHCSLTDDPTFKKWDCMPGLVCRPDHAVDKNALLGVCMNKEVMAGDPCDVGVVHTNANPHRDQVIQRKPVGICGQGRYCLQAWEGFPDGLCFGNAMLKSQMKLADPLPWADSMNVYLQTNPWPNLVRNHTSLISLRTCDEETPCRDDFICAVGKGGQGSCIPPYFLFQDAS